jgi:hypothetical protein
MNIRRLAVFVAVLLPVSAFAAVRCDFTTVLTSPPYSYGGKLIIEGDRSRIDINDGNHPLFNPTTSVITRDAGAEIIILDHARKTWSQRPGKALGGHLSTTRGINMATTASEAEVRTDRDGDEHRLRANYTITMEVEGERFPATVELEVVSEIGSMPRQAAFPWGLQFAAKTGFEKVDRQIERRMPMRLPMRQVVTASRQIEGGPKVSETITISLANVSETDVDANIFFPPKGYRYEVPIFEFGTSR